MNKDLEQTLEEQLEEQFQRLEKILDEASNNSDTISIRHAMRVIYEVYRQAGQHLPLSDKEDSLLLSLVTSFVATIHMESLVKQGKMTLEEAKEISGADVVRVNKMDA